MTAVAVAVQPARARRTPAPGRQLGADITARLRRASGQLDGVRTMYEDGRYCIDVLDQLSAVSAAVDSVALLILHDHVNACIRDAMEHGDTDEKVTELITAVRRYVRSR